MNVNIATAWQPLLSSEFQKPYFTQLAHFVRSEYNQHTCYPKGKEIFAAFEHCSPQKVKVVIIGQDPYHGPGQANGLCFSVRQGTAHPPSLINIFKEIEQDIGQPYPENGDLQRWAEQGVLLLNAVLTVRARQPGSHQNKGWEAFTDAVIQKLSAQRKGLIFMLWGGFAKKKAALIDPERHFILRAGHPSPLSANRGYWFGNNHFSQANELLKRQGLDGIQW
ncbi:uracil-DNA glycosylase [Robiginitalea sp. IMCC44478]|uniref:uracil-DNA glycosylase n=1 Tax=Robiginitalea sp. IMCC44478 TaxID=3459122 RepID=UPI0040421C57